jgi:hypothetical protein
MTKVTSPLAHRIGRQLACAADLGSHATLFPVSLPPTRLKWPLEEVSPSALPSTDLVSQGVQLLPNHGDLFELDILFIAHLQQEVFHTREAPRHGLDDGGYNGRDLATRRGFFGIPRTLLHVAQSP